MKKKEVALIVIMVGIIVFCLKYWSYLVSNSVALLSDALESVVNILASVMMLFSILISEKPPDETHNYGHQKIEDISSGLEGIFIIAAALLIINTAIGRLFESAGLLELNLAIGISIIATFLNAGISVLLMRTAKHNESVALEGDAKHLLSDVISTVGVWIGLLIAQVTSWQFMDSFLAFIVSAIILKMGIGLVLRSTKRLMDHSCPDEEQVIEEVLSKYQTKVIEFHDLKTRKQGSRILAEVHLTVEDSMSVRKAHDIIDEIENELEKISPNIVLTIHIDPESEMRL